MKDKNYLLLQEQLCFPVYASSRMIIRLYQPWLEKLDLTYPQYLVMLALWEQDNQNVGQICKKLFLNTNTLTPILKKMRGKGLVEKSRSEKDERTVFISLTNKGKELKESAESIPLALLESIDMPLLELEQMKQFMWKFLKSFE